MLAIEAQRAGGPDVLRAVERPVPRPGPGEILIRHQAVGLNFIDTYQRSGLYPVPMPAILGLEAAGMVEAVGEGVTRFAPGDRAAYANGPLGAYSQAHVVPQGKAVRVPPGVPLETAAASLLKGMTAEFLLRRLRSLSAGETILVHAAAGGVGQVLVQWAKAMGLVVIGTAGGAEKRARAAALGCDLVVDSREGDIAAAVRAFTDGKGVSVVYDSVGAATFEASLASLSRRGLFASFGNASGPVAAFEPLRLARAGSLSLTRPVLGDYVSTPGELDDSAAAFFEIVQSGKVVVDIGQTFPLAQAQAAHEALEARATVGASLLLP